MRKEGEILTITQGLFIDYINEHIDNSKRIIFYKHNGHFGSGYAIKSCFKGVEILPFKILKNRTRKSICFRILHIIAAMGTFILNTTEKIDARTSIGTILTNMENIYLGIDKEKEYLKYLRIRKYRHKYGKIKFVVRVEDNDIQTDEDVNCLRLLCKLIQSGKIINTILLISGDKISFMNLGIEKYKESIPLFQISENDLRFIAQRNNIEIIEKTYNSIQLITRFGLRFFLDNYMYFDDLSEIQEQTYDWLKRMDWIITQIIQRSNVAREEIYPLLEFASFFENNFSKIEIQKFNNNQLRAENLDVAHKLTIISREKSSKFIIPTYFYKIDSFKYYFSNRYTKDLQPMPEHIFHFFRKYYPFEYLPMLKVLQIDSSFVDYKNIQSLVLSGYYYQKNEKGIVDYKDYTCFTAKDSTANAIIGMYEYFRSRQQNEFFCIDILSIIKKIRNDSFDNIATCASYVMLLQYIKENYEQVPLINFTEVLNSFRSKILDIETDDNYGKYWQGHFKCQYIALALEDENADDRTSRRFLDDIQKSRENENLSMFISTNHLRGFSRIDLLAFSLNNNTADEILQNLYVSSENSTVLKELARINYSSYLIENQKYDEAEKVLQKVDLEFLENINIDTYCGYLNNLYLVQLECKKITAKEYIIALENLLQKDISCGDKYIIINNLSTAYIKSGFNETYGEKKLREILEKGNPYNRFYALHNLLAYYYTQNNRTKFDEIYSNIFIPKLLRPDTTFFHKKFEWMKEKMGILEFNAFVKSSNVIAGYNNLYLMSSIERWFE